MTSLMIDTQAAERIGSLKQPWLIVTDLDGTLLDHHNYSHQAVDPLLLELEKRSIPVVFNTSKTLAELRLLRTELNNRHPFVVENGSAIYMPPGYFSSDPASKSSRQGEFDCILLGRPADEIHDWLAKTRHGLDLHFVGFAEMSIQELMASTGLDESKAELAKQRHYSEAIHWRDSDAQRERFRRAAEAAGFKLLQGGRFLHVLGSCDKGQASRRLADEYAARTLQPHAVIAAGDSANDVAMLEAADLAIAVRSPVHDFPWLSPGQACIQTSQFGPQGWAEAVRYLLEHGRLGD